MYPLIRKNIWQTNSHAEWINQFLKKQKTNSSFLVYFWLLTPLPHLQMFAFVLVFNTFCNVH